MAISFDSIGTVCATFQAATPLSVGSVCKMASNGYLSECAAGDGFLGRVETADGDLHAVTVRGFVTLKYSGTLPSYGVCKLSADGSGGVKVDSEKGLPFHVVQLDTVNHSVTVLL